MVGKQVTLREGYYWYKEQEAEGDRVTRYEYQRIIRMFFRFFMDKVYEGHKVDMGAALGHVYIRGNPKPKAKAVDWGETRKYWRTLAKKRDMTFMEFIATVPRGPEKPLVYHLNEHTDGIRFGVAWDRHEVKLLTKSMYSLIFTRHNKRKCARLVNEGKEYEVIREYIDTKATTAKARGRPKGINKLIKKKHYEKFKQEATQDRVQQ